MVGNLGRDVQVTETAQGIVGRTTLAVKRKDKDADWYQIELYDALATEASQKLRTGTRVHVQGRLRQDPYEDKGMNRLNLVVSVEAIYAVDDAAPRLQNQQAPPLQSAPPQHRQQQAPTVSFHT